MPSYARDSGGVTSMAAAFVIVGVAVTAVNRNHGCGGDGVTKWQPTEIVLAVMKQNANARAIPLHLFTRK